MTLPLHGPNIITLAGAKVVGTPLLEVVGAPVVREGFLQRRRRATSLLVVGTHLHTKARHIAHNHI